LINNGDVATVIATSTDGEAALSCLASEQPDMVLLDVSMPGMNGIEVARQILKQWTNLPILAVSAQANSVYIRGMMDAGARGYMLKDNAGDEINPAIKTIMEGGNWIGRGLPEA
jgi:DNA-binding NarL/FixJ family response regulator